MPEYNPLVSIIVATYNMGKYVNEAIDSILHQDYQHIEIIVVNDGSTDNTEFILQKYQNHKNITIIKQNNCGQTIAKNLGLQEAKGEFIGFCDADNIWYPDKLSKQIPCFKNYENIGVVYSDIKRIDQYGNLIYTPPVKRYSGTITKHLLIDNFVTFNTALVPRNVITEIGYFDKSLDMGIDYDLWLRISTKYLFHYISEPLVYYRVWDGQMSHRMEERFTNWFKILDKFKKENSSSVSKYDLRKGTAHTFVSRGYRRAMNGNFAMAISDYLKAFFLRPHDKRLWRCIVKNIVMHSTAQLKIY